MLTGIIHFNFDESMDMQVIYDYFLSRINKIVKKFHFYFTKIIITYRENIHILLAQTNVLLTSQQ